MKDKQTQVFATLIASGFPFQTAIESIIRSIQGWKAPAVEYPWRDEDGQDKFIDLVTNRGFLTATIECKKSQKQVWTFLNPQNTSADKTGIRCTYLTQIDDSTHRLDLYYAQWYLFPASHEAEFCVISTSDSGQNRLLEPDAQLLIRGSDAHALHLKKYYKWQNVKVPDNLYIPIIVTNASLFVAPYDPNDISLETGQFKDGVRPNLIDIPWIRFTKTFTTDLFGQQLVRRTVFVVNALNLHRFMQDLDLQQGRLPDRFPGDTRS